MRDRNEKEAGYYGLDLYLAPWIQKHHRLWKLKTDQSIHSIQMQEVMQMAEQTALVVCLFSRTPNTLNAEGAGIGDEGDSKQHTQTKVRPQEARRDQR